jgi:UDP-glucose 4-epimerase
MAVLITGGAGYIGTTIAHTLTDAGVPTVILDDLSTGTNPSPANTPSYDGDLADTALLDEIFTSHRIDTVIHCAARISVPESLNDPLRYYDTNVAKSITLLQAMRRHHVERIVFSSSAAVYGDATGHLPETTPRAPATPYARSKAMLEDVLHDAATAGALRAIVLRYFNPVGADLLMRVGRSAHAPKHALQHLLDACWNDEVFTIAGDDWDTHDGTPLRDFVDVTDLAHAHRHAVERFETITTPEQPYQVFNIGTGTGTTIGELAAATADALNQPLHTRIGPRRTGDITGAAATTTKAEHELVWTATELLTDSIRRAADWAELQHLRSTPTRDLPRPRPAGHAPQEGTAFTTTFMHT